MNIHEYSGCVLLPANYINNFFTIRGRGQKNEFSTGAPRIIRNLEYLRIILIIIKKGRQCKAERESYTPYQSEDPSPTIPTYRQKEEKGKRSRRVYNG